jgi:hypothetical protein
MKIRVGLAAAMGAILIPLAVAQRTQTRHSTAQQRLAQSQPAAPQPIAPPTPEQRPATPPQVAYNGGLLTITADNSTLGDILRAVHRQTGATIDVPGNATERVVGRFGPGPARDVVASLLNGSHFNYVLVGSETDPRGLDRVVLISKPGSDQAPVEQARFQGRMQPPVPQPVDAGDAASDDDAAQDMIPDASEATDEQANQAQGEEPAQAQQPGQSAIKTPEQLLQELQQRQQQMQQQQQGAPVPPGYPPNPNAGPTPQQK